MTDIWEIPSSRPGTSEAAAKAIAPVAGTIRREVYDLIRDAGAVGMTDEEVSERLGLDSSTTRPRRWRRSLKNFTYHFRHMVRLLGDRDADALRVADVEAYKATRLEEGAAPATINNELALLRRGYTLAHRLELVNRIPAIVRLSVQNARQGFCEPDLFARIVRTLEVLHPAAADAARWLYLLGWRRSEALGLTWDEVNPETGHVHLPAGRSKNGYPRSLRVMGDLLALARRRWEQRQGRYVFHHRQGRRIWSFRESWRKATADAGKPGLLVHDLRRSFCRNAVQAKVPAHLIMLLGGWRTAAVFYRYCITDEGLTADAIVAVAE